MKEFGEAAKVHASDTIAQSSMTSVKVSAFIFITELNSHSGRSFSSESMSISANEKSLFTLSWIPIFNMLASFSKVKAAPGLQRLRTAFRLSRLRPRISSFSSSNSANKSVGILK